MSSRIILPALTPSSTRKTQMSQDSEGVIGWKSEIPPPYFRSKKSQFCARQAMLRWPHIVHTRSRYGAIRSRGIVWQPFED